MRRLLNRLSRSPVGAAWRSAPVRRVRYRLAWEPGNADLKGIFEGRRAFIIGHGPSILEQDLLKLRNEVVFCLNHFFYHPQFHEIRPDFLCATDPGLAELGRRKQWYALHQQYGTQYVPKLFNVRTRRRDRRHNLFQDHEVRYVYAASATIPPLWEHQIFPTDLTRPLANFGIVAFDVALPAALYTGCKEIVLIGFDGGEIRTLEDYLNYNFYGKDPLSSMERYRRDFERFFGNQATHEAERAKIWEKALPVIERTMEAHGARLLHATPVGKVFPGVERVRYEELFQ